MINFKKLLKKKRRLSIDIETYSDVDLKTRGVYLYVNSPNFDVLIITFKFEDSYQITTIDTTRLNEPEQQNNLKLFKAHLTNENILKVAYNASFERICLSVYFGIQYDVSSWTCTLVKGARGAMPIGLGQIARVLNVNTQKDGKGAALIRLFSIPDRKTGKRIFPTTPELGLEWSNYINYNIDDVKAEIDVNDSLDYVRVPAWQELLYQIDQRINDLGVKIDMDFISKIMEIMQVIDATNLKKSFLLSGLINPKSTKHVKQYLESELNESLESTDKKTLEALLDRPFLPEHIKEFIFVKLSLSKSSIAKFKKMELLAHPKDHRARGLFQFYGAIRTGRWAGRGIQLQNLPKISIDSELATWRKIIKNSTVSDAISAIETIFGNVAYFCSQMVRPSFIPETGNSFVIADFSSIENRVLAWLAGEQWKIDAFNAGRDVYIETAIKMFHLDPDKDYKGTPERQKGKVLELAGGYQGGVQALIRAGILPTVVKDLTAQWNKEKSDESLDAYLEANTEKEIKQLVTNWRGVNSNIKRFWYDTQKAAIKAIQGYPNTLKGLKFFRRKGHLIIKLLSGRELVYPNASVKKVYSKELHKEVDQIYYWGLDGFSKAWLKRETYGGSLVENITQATACDLLAWSMIRCDNLGMKIVMHVHDEIVIECKTKNANNVLSKLLEIMSTPVKWAEGLQLKGEGQISQFYTK